MAQLNRAVRIAADAHDGQLDKSGQAYLHHPLRVMAAVQQHGEHAQIVAVLHDVVEDSAVTFDDLRAEGFGDPLIQSLQCLTHSREEPYVDYIVRCKADHTARLVKLADLVDNARLDRVLLRPDSLPRDLRRIQQYALAYKFLTDILNEEQYRAAMVGNEH